MALCVVVCPAGRADVLAGRCASSTWFGPSQTPMSGHIQFAVNLTGTGASSAQFTIVRSDDTQLSLYASGTPMQGGAVYAITPAIGTFGWPNGEWEVTAQASTNSGPIFWGPTTFDIKSLNVTGLTATGSSSVLDSRFFVSVRPGAAQGLDLEGTWTDGYEISLPMGNNPNLVDVTYGLRPLSLGTQSSAPATGVAPGAIVAAMTNVVPGLYYKTASGVERRPMYESGNDGAATQATALTISTLTKNSFCGGCCGQPRTGHLHVDVRTTDVPPNSAATDGEWAWRTPSGDLEVTSGGAHPDDSMATYELTSPTLEFDEAGTYILAATFRDDHARPHDGAKEYCTPKSTTVTIPASAHFAGEGNPGADWQEQHFDGIVDQAYARVGAVAGQWATFGAGSGPIVWPAGPSGVPSAWSFYSGRAPVGDRGGAVKESLKSRFLQACAEDAIIHFAGHGGDPMCEDPTCPGSLPNNPAQCPNPAHAGYRPYRLVLQQNDPSNSVEPSDITAGMLSGARLVVLSTCHQLEPSPSAIGRVMYNTGGAPAVIGYCGLGALLWNVSGEYPGLPWVDDKLWSLLCNVDLFNGIPTAMTATQAVYLTQEAWDNRWGATYNAATWNIDKLICLGDSTIAPAF